MNTRSRSGARAKKELDAKTIKTEEIVIDSAEEEEQNVDNESSSEEEPEYVPKSVKKKTPVPRSSAKKESKPRAKSTVQKIAPKSELKIESGNQDRGEDLDNDHDNELGYELSEKEMKEVNHAFDMNQTDDELLTTDGLRTAMRSLGLEPRGDGIQKLMKKYAVKKGKVNRDGFHKIMALKYAASPGMANDNNSNDEISRVFNLLDLEKTGYITIDNLKSIAKELNENLTDDELMEMICEADSDGDLKIDKEDFYKIMKKTNLY